MELIFAAILLLFVIGIPLLFAVWMIFAKMRRKTSADYEPRIVQTNQPNNFIPPEIADDFDESFKRCPTCKSTFTDTSLNFCLADGTPLDFVVRQSQINKPAVTQILEKPFASVPTIVVKKDKNES